jgi:Fe2+ transport system protein FeoA
MGVVQGSLVTIENNSNHGPISILNQDGMKIAIGRRLAEKVEVTYV